MFQIPCNSDGSFTFPRNRCINLNNCYLTFTSSQPLPQSIISGVHIEPNDFFHQKTKDDIDKVNEYRQLKNKLNNLKNRRKNLYKKKKRLYLEYIIYAEYYSLYQKLYLFKEKYENMPMLLSDLNDNINKYRTLLQKEFNNINIKEELIANVCHPRNYWKFEALGFFE